MHNPVLRLRHAEPERLHRSAGRSGTDRAAPCRRTARSGTIPHEPADQPYRTRLRPRGRRTAKLPRTDQRLQQPPRLGHLVERSGQQRGGFPRADARRKARQRRAAFGTHRNGGRLFGRLHRRRPERALDRTAGLRHAGVPRTGTLAGPRGRKRTGALRTDARTIRDRSPAATGPRPQRRLLRHPALRFARSPGHRIGKRSAAFHRTHGGYGKFHGLTSRDNRAARKRQNG